MKAKKKLAAEISQALQQTLTASASGSRKIRKAIEETAEKLADKVTKIAAKKDKQLQQANNDEGDVSSIDNMAKRQEFDAGSKGVMSTERESLLAK